MKMIYEYEKMTRKENYEFTYKATGIEVVDRYRMYEPEGSEGCFKYHKVYFCDDMYIVVDEDDNKLYCVYDWKKLGYEVYSYKFNNNIEVKNEDGSVHKYGFVWTEIN